MWENFPLGIEIAVVVSFLDVASMIGDVVTNAEGNAFYMSGSCLTLFGTAVKQCDLPWTHITTHRSCALRLSKGAPDVQYKKLVANGGMNGHEVLYCSLNNSNALAVVAEAGRRRPCTCLTTVLMIS